VRLPTGVGPRGVGAPLLYGPDGLMIADIDGKLAMLVIVVAPDTD
jgi:hypothetical protein